MSALRAELAAEAARLRAAGLVCREIGERMGISRSYAAELIHDPDGAKVGARKASYVGVCEDCGGPTDGSNGRAKAPRLCIVCTNKRREPPHGTVSRYHSGCPCDECREANRLAGRARLGKPPPTHGVSGYMNYGCRCDVCSKAHTDYLWMRPEYRWAWEQRVRGTEPPEHGTVTAYRHYACRCDVCREANAARARAYRERRKAAA